LRSTPRPHKPPFDPHTPRNLHGKTLGSGEVLYYACPVVTMTIEIKKKIKKGKPVKNLRPT
jgi:hypothetical protein